VCRNRNSGCTTASRRAAHKLTTLPEQSIDAAHFSKILFAMPDSSKNLTTRFRWVICALLFFACVINYMDREVLGLLKPELVKTFHWTEKDFAKINMCFQASYALGQAAVGPLMEFFGTKGTYAFSIAFWSLAAMAHSLVSTVSGWGGARVALGLGESGNFPTAFKTVTEWFPPKERSVATGLFNSGSNVAKIISPLLVPWLFAMCGWRGTFIAVGLAGFAWLALWLWLYHAPEKSVRVSPAELAHIRSGTAENAEERIPWTQLLGYREAWAYHLTGLLIGPVWWFYGFWLPGFFHDQFNLDLKNFGPPLALVGAGAALGSIFGGGLSAYFLKRGWTVNRARKTAALLCALCTLPVISTPYLHDKWLAAFFFALASAAHQGWTATMYPVVGDMFPKRAVPSVIGFGGTLASLMALAFFWFVSTQLDGKGSYGTIMLICGSAYVIGWIIFHIGVPVIKPVKIK
jgi:ACS family hexuronate transporter-like MFS transporter